MKPESAKELAPCPCGKTPKQLDIVEGSTYRWRYVAGDCCGEWTIEVRVNYGNSEKEINDACVEYWNDATRGVK